ncbi:hypothetical protein EV148_101311 [Dokdonella fugitiva]|jgi:hypothetical protein|uniref:Beta/gamma crystallin n=2 Tax=Dokdonella fugitiva TaxID=328517 RepID=A0A4R2IE59_9GAMM|nr:hypothetical protein EV148_101311 [Dokdonella fugitiva]
MHMFTTRLCRRARLLAPAIAFGACAVLLASPVSDSRAGTPTYSIGFHRISSGAARLRGACYRVAGSVGEAAPGYSSGPTMEVISGFWTAAANPPDQMFFSGFEGC